MNPRISTKNTPLNRCNKNPITRKALASILDGDDGAKLMVMFCDCCCCRTPKRERAGSVDVNKKEKEVYI